MTSVVAQIVDCAVPSLQKMFQRQQVRLRQIANVYVVANAGSIGRRIVRTVYLDIIAFARGDFQHQWNQMGLGIMTLTQPA